MTLDPRGPGDTRAPAASTRDPRAGLLREMMRIRHVEETLADLYRDEQQMRTPTHFSIGQEAAAVGVCAALRSGDVVYSGHRCHAHYLAKGGDLPAMVAELHGKETGCAGGRGGSVHLTDLDAGFVASSAILGETIATAAGSAWAFRMDGRPQVAVAFFGDGAAEEGVFHETLNFAVVQRVPVLFVCENNLYSIHSPLSVRQPADVALHDRARSYGMPARQVDGNDVFAVYDAAAEAVEWCRAGNGPAFVECLTYRWREHVGPLWDHDAGYRSKDEVDAWMRRCPVEHATRVLRADGLVTDTDLARWRAEIADETSAAVAAAKASPYPPVAELMVGTT